MPAQKIVGAILGGSDCDIVNFYFPFGCCEKERRRAFDYYITDQGCGLSVMGRAKRLTVYWYGVVVIAGFGFGMLGERRPFGNDMLAHPLVVYFLGVTAGLLLMRVVLRRPVPARIPERALFLGCIAGLAMFLVGNFIASHLLGR
jgi:hypothetical protein